MVLPYYNYISHWSGHTQSTLVQFGTHICIRMLNCFRMWKSLLFGWLLKDGIVDIRNFQTWLLFHPQRQEGYSRLCVCCTRLFTTCATFRQTSLHLDLMLVRELTGNFCYINHSPTQMHICTYFFVPRTVNIWYSLPESVVTAPMHLFNNNIMQYLQLVVSCVYCSVTLLFVSLFCQGTLYIS